MVRKVSWIGVVVVLMIGLFSGPAVAAIIGLRPVDQNILNAEGEIQVLPDSFFDVQLYFEGLTSLNLGSNGLVAMGVSVVWDPLVNLTGATNGGKWPNMSITPSPGQTPPAQVDIYADVPFNAAPISQDHIIATFTLHCLGEGETTLMPKGTLDVPFNFALANFDYLDSQITFQGITINQESPFVPVVPIPSALLLFGSGLMGVVGLRRKGKK